MGTRLFDLHARSEAGDPQEDRRHERPRRSRDGRTDQRDQRIQGAVCHEKEGSCRREMTNAGHAVRASLIPARIACPTSSVPSPFPMAKARALDRRRKSIRNIRRITRTMELIATARFKKAMDRAHAATAYTMRITQL